ncbi:umta protein, partial [Colletotrichum incanum]
LVDMATNSGSATIGQTPATFTAESAADGIAADPAIDNEGDNLTADTASVITSSTASLSESVTEYRRIHGRTYTQKTDYWGPNDEKQNEGLELNHYWQTLFLGDKLFLAPIGESPYKVLDVGTGTGIWAMAIVILRMSFLLPKSQALIFRPSSPRGFHPTANFRLTTLSSFGHGQQSTSTLSTFVILKAAYQTGQSCMDKLLNISNQVDGLKLRNLISRAILRNLAMLSAKTTSIRDGLTSCLRLWNALVKPVHSLAITA